MKRVLTIFVICIATIAAVILPSWPPTHIVHAESVAKIEAKITKALEETAKLDAKVAKLKVEESKNQSKQSQAAKAQDLDKVRELKSEGDKIGRKLNGLRQSIATQEATLHRLRTEVRSEALKEVRAAIAGSKSNPKGKSLVAGDKAAKAWSAALKAMHLPSHLEERLPRRSTADSRKRAKREQSRLSEHLSELKAEKKRSSSEAKALQSFCDEALVDPAWPALKGKLEALLNSVQGREKGLAKAIKKAEARASALKNHLK